MYCKHCGAQIDDAAKFCSNCAAPTDNHIAASPVQPVKISKSKTWPLVIGVLSIILSVFIMFQSCAAGLANAMEENNEMSGSTGLLVAIMYLAGGIVLIATRKHKSKVPAMILYLIGSAVVALLGIGTYADLELWAWISFVLAVLCLISTIRAKAKKKIKL